MPLRIFLDLLDLLLVVSEFQQRLVNRLIYDLEISSARKLLEFHYCEIRLDAGGVSIHNESDSARRRDDCYLRIAVAVFFAESVGAVPCIA